MKKFPIAFDEQSLRVAQHFNAKSVVIGFDVRETSPTSAVAASRGARDAAADIINIGMAGTV